MPRWLVASFIAFVLSCYGFAAAAQVETSGHLPVNDCKAVASIVDQAPAGDVESHDANSDLANFDDAESDFTEFLTGVRPLLVPAVAAVWPPRTPPVTAPLPLLDRPKRPPRSADFLA